MDKAVIGSTWLAHQRKFAVAPVEGASIHNHTAQTGSVATDPFGCTLHNHVRTMLDRSQQGTAGSERVVHDQRDATLPGQGGESLEIRDVEAWVAHGFHVDGLGAVIDLCSKTGDVITFGESNVDPKPGELNLELVVGASIEK
ncbi:MAG: Uncharacterised protein [Cyanobium sp. ARS6]|nr:MAG: Uncharacterised protein [Cyanobium sp. ARS6]